MCLGSDFKATGVTKNAFNCLVIAFVLKGLTTLSTHLGHLNGSASTVRFARDPHRHRDKPIRLGLVGPPLLRAGATHRECPGDSGLGRGHEFGRLSFRVSIGIVLESQASRQVKPVKTSCWVGSPAHSFATCPSSERESRLRLKALID